jgi:RNA polymerase sigma-70 factor (ECF subfamily)
MDHVSDVADPDRDLAERFRAGERAAFDQIVRRHQQGVWRLVRRYVKRDADAADVTQLVFVRAFKGLGGFRGSASVRSWLYRIAINCSLSWLRDHRREQPAEIDEDAISEPPAAPGRLASGEQAAQLRAAIAQLPPKQKLVLELRVFDDLSFKEVAELAECSENTAKVNFHYAVKKLRDILGGSHGG